MEHIQLLDCTLRDGGHINDSLFGKDVIKAIIHNLSQSRVDIIEVGFLQDCNFNEDCAMFNNVAEAKMVIHKKLPGAKYSLMAQADLYSIDKLEENDGFIDMVRISFHDNHISEGLEFCRKVMEKGYQCSVNPINLLGYTDKEVLGLLEQVNNIHPHAFAIVDTFGSMLKSDLQRLYYMIDNNLQKDTKISLHLHENQALSYSLAQDFIGMKTPTRDIMIDGSLFGMGRVPGNLCIELIMSYMNRTQGSNYDLDPVFDAIDEHIVRIKSQYPWGYATAYSLSARYKVHRTYAEYLMDKGRLKTKQINQILAMIEENKKTRYDKQYIENLYIKYQNIDVDDLRAVKELYSIFHDKQVLLVGPGNSIVSNEEKIKKLSSSVPVIAANFVWNRLETDYAFFTNSKRYDEFREKTRDEKIIITSNLLPMQLPYDYVVNYSGYAFYNGKLMDNCMIMLLKLMKKLEASKVYMAGFDGFGSDTNFAIASMEHEVKNYNEQDLVTKVLQELKQEGMQIEFLTESKYI